MVVQSFEYFFYEVYALVDKPGFFSVSPAWGYPLQWGESYEDSWTMSADMVLSNFDVKEQDLNLSGETR